MIDPLKQLLARRKLRAAYQDIFSTNQGKLVLADILARSGVTRPTITADPHLIHHNEGMRRLALSIFREVHASMDTLPDYIAEEQRKLEEQQKDEQ